MYKYYETMTASPFNRHTPVPPISPHPDSWNESHAGTLSRRPSNTSATLGHGPHGHTEQSRDDCNRHSVTEHLTEESDEARVDNLINDYTPLSAVTSPLLNARLSRELINSQESQASEDRDMISSLGFEITRRMMRLYATIDDPRRASRVTCANDLRFIRKFMKLDGEKSKKFTPRLIQLGLLELCQHICITNIAASSNPSTSGADDCINVLQLRLALRITFTVTDMSAEACRRFIDVELHDEMFTILKGDHTYSCKPSTVLGILFNVVQVVAEARELYRDNDAVRLMHKFRSSPDTDVITSSMALVLTAYVINEDENSLLGSDGKLFDFLASELKTAVQNDKHRSNNLLKVIEVLGAVNKLAVNESNQDKLIASGVLDSYATLLESECSTDEHFEVAKGLWTLASHCPADVLQFHRCVNGLMNLAMSCHNEGVKNQAKGALRALGITSEDLLGLSISSTTNVPISNMTSLSFSGNRYGHVFISYNHASRTICYRLRDRLRAAGLRVWIDADAMRESLAEDIIEGLDKSSVVLICMSQKYYESPYCKKEVIYAVDCQKKIIPLIVEPRYKPHGWLKFHTSDGLRFDFSRNDLFEESFKKLISQIRSVFESIPVTKEESPEKITDISQNENVHPSIEPTVSQVVSLPIEADQPVLVDPVDVDDNQNASVDDTAQYSKLLALNTPLTSRRSSRGGQSAAGADTTDVDVLSWTTSHVSSWLRENGIQHLWNWFTDYDGKLLLQLKRLKRESPDLFAAGLHRELNAGRLLLNDIPRISEALELL